MTAVCSTDSLRDRTRAMLDQILLMRPGSADYPEPQTDRDRLEDLIKKTVRASVQISGDYHENGGGSWQKWMLTVLGGLTVVAVVGGVVMYGELAALRQDVQGLHDQVNRVEKIVEPRYRGG